MLSARALKAAKTSESALRDDYDECLELVRATLYARIEAQVRRGKTQFTVMDFTTVLCDQERMPRTNVKPSTLFTGFWDKERKEHDFAALTRVGRGPLLAALVALFAPLGYELCDVSDPTRSQRRVLAVSVGDA